MSKVLIATGDAAESLEVMYPYQRLLEEGYEVHIAAPSKKKLQFVVHDFVDDFDTYTEKPGYTWPADLAFREVDPARYAALVIPGGRGAGVHPQRPGLPADHPALLRAREAGGAALPRGARARGGGRAARAADGGVPGAGAGRARGGGGVRRRGGGGGRRHGVGAGVAGSPGVDAGVRASAEGGVATTLVEAGTSAHSQAAQPRAPRVASMKSM